MVTLVEGSGDPTVGMVRKGTRSAGRKVAERDSGRGAYEVEVEGRCIRVRYQGDMRLILNVVAGTGQVDERFIRKLLNERIRRMV